MESSLRSEGQDNWAQRPAQQSVTAMATVPPTGRPAGLPPLRTSNTTKQKSRFKLFGRAGAFEQQQGHDGAH